MGSRPTFAVAIHGRRRLILVVDVITASEDVDTAFRLAAKVGYDELIGRLSLPSNPFGIDYLFRVHEFIRSKRD